jgi:hypothetical protein
MDSFKNLREVLNVCQRKSSSDTYLHPCNARIIPSSFNALQELDADTEA